ncbi:CaiB/BaiF CoA transferase family protein [Rhodococcus sp. SMB37]|nr:CaiB/BaiF CoA-transferase family protein [Rhodococcus sp. SMB37]TCN53640.1 CoA:oxalate CoA-transferase [Rhodococcus sp. SMB37]
MIDIGNALAGRTVVEICNYVSGPMVGRNLAALGANVLKIERPGTGDDGRHSYPAFDGDGLFFTETAYGKKSVVLDLKSEAGLATAVDMIDKADILIENMRPSVMSRIGLDPAMLVSRNPKLVVGSVNAFGTTGPRADDPAYDPVIQAATGIMYTTGFKGDPPKRIGASIVDKTAALWGTIEVLAAVLEVDRTGEGGHFSVSLLSSAVHLMGADVLRFLATGEDSAPSQPRAGGAGASHGAYRTADHRWIQVAIGNDRMFERLCQAAGRPEILEDPRFATHLLRGENRYDEQEVMERVFAERDSAEWVKILHEVRIPYALVNRIPEFIADNELSAPFMGVATRTDGTEIPLVRGPLDPESATGESRRVPRLGEDTVSVLRSHLNLSDDAIRDLATRGAFGADPALVL